MTFFSNKAVVKDIRQWTMPRLTESATRSYISFSAFDPESGEMKRKKIHLGRIKSKKQLRDVAGRMTKRLIERLSEGWNPWIEAENPLGFVEFEEVCNKYRDYMMRAYKNDDMREQTALSYSSYLHIFEEWGLEHGIRFCYQIEKPKIAMFLDYVYIERNNSLRTRNGYLGWLKTFTHWLMDRSYLTTNPTEGFSKTNKRGEKSRKGLPSPTVRKVSELLKKENPYFLLACDVLFYCFIRPKEMALLKIGDINVQSSTIYVSAEIAKNRKEDNVTVPSHVMKLMLELGVLQKPTNWYIFSKDFRPGPEYKKERQFREYWKKMRERLKLPSTYKFYSLKDTGITGMVHAGKDMATVRDQARHSDISITNIYVGRSNKKGNPEIIDYVGDM